MQNSNKKLLKKVGLILYASSMLLLSCHGHITHIKNIKTYKRDSTYIVYAVNAWIKTENVPYFEKSKFYCADTNQPKPNIIIDTILYSPDKSKLYAIVIIQYETCTMSTSDKLPYGKFTDNKIYAARGIIGFKDSTTGLWKLYHYSPLTQQGFTIKKILIEKTRKFFFTSYKEIPIKKSRKDGNFILEPCSYNINDPDFWTKCWIWQKGLILMGYYNFQLKEASIFDKDEPLKDIPISFPDSLLQQFR